MLFNIKNRRRKEKDSFLAHNHMSIKTVISSTTKRRESPNICEKRASLYTSFLTKGSLTIEASLAIPIFLFALIAIIYLMEMLAMQMCVRIGMHSAIESLCEESSLLWSVSTNEMEEMIVEAIGEEKLEKSIIVDGKNGIDCSESEISVTSGVITLRATYVLKLPLPQFGDIGLTYQEEMTSKAWIGYVSGITNNQEQVVYITDNASVYHTDLACTHLALDISAVSYEGLDNLRNEYGEIYSGCSKCIGEVDEGTLDNGIVYICNTGSHYHSSLSCSGLTRTIYEVSLSEVIGMGICSRCGGE